jgi:hypothetical protein
MLGLKRLEILRELAPSAVTIGVFVNPHNRTSEADAKELQSAVVAGRQRLVVISAGPADDLTAALAEPRQPTTKSALHRIRMVGYRTKPTGAFSRLN